MTPFLLKTLRQIDTPTVCNAIEVAQGKRGFQGFTHKTMLCSAPCEPAMVGYARTAKIKATQPPSKSPEEVRNLRMAYYKYMAEGSFPAVAVIEDEDFPDCIGAFWGEINTTIHKGFGLSGTLTNGLMRDLGDCPGGYPVVAGSIGPSHGFVHVTELACDVDIYGLTLSPGDLVHADRHGAVVIPPAVLPFLEQAIQKLRETEAIILTAARTEGFTFEAFERAWSQFEATRT